MADEIPTPTPAPAGDPWWKKLYTPAMLSAIAMLITAISGVVGAYVQKTLKQQAEKEKK
jgi:hypothetical protein